MSNPFLGEIRIFAFNFAPKGWATCDGRPLATQQNQNLYALIGTTYGGDGTTFFNLPDLQGRLAIGFGQGNGLTNRLLGEVGGAEEVTLASAEMPVHTHTMTASTTASASNPASAVYATASDPLYADPIATNTKAAASGPMAAGAIGISGGGQPHENRPPILVMNVCMATEGIYPTRN